MRVNSIGAPPSSCCATKKSQSRENLNFNGYKFHILDGGIHSDIMTHFARALGKDANNYTKLTLHDVGLLPSNQGLKDLKSLNEKLLHLEQENILKPNDFLAIPVTAPIELNSLSYHLNSDIKLTPQNVKSQKKTILDFLDNASVGKLELMDRENQGFKHLTSIIKTVNRLVNNGVNVYIPSDHPLEAAIKWNAEQLGIKDSLYKYISTGYDDGGKIQKIIKDLKADNAYKFNLLTLSDAHVVNLQNRFESGDYIFSAYDTCVTDRARGVYNFCPVRDSSGKILGYSFTDKTTVEYPYDEFYGNDDIANLCHFVGKKMSDFPHDWKDIHVMKSLISWCEPHDKVANIPYRIADIFSAKKIAKRGLTAKGEYIDRTETLFFDTNRDDEFIFRRCDCDGSGRPSVVSMWGSCFATVNLITKTIRSQLRNLFDVKLPKLLSLAKENNEMGCELAAEEILLKARELAKPEIKGIPRKKIEFDIAVELANIYAKQGRLDEVKKLMIDMIPDHIPNKYKYIEYRMEQLRENLNK